MKNLLYYYKKMCYSILAIIYISPEIGNREITITSIIIVYLECILILIQIKSITNHNNKIKLTVHIIILAPYTIYTILERHKF